MAEKTKRCSTCREIKSLLEFHKDSTKGQGRCNECKMCRSKRSKTWHSKTKNKCWWLKRKFGITLEQYDRMFEEQGGVCVICGKEETSTFQGIIRRLAVDHDHKTGKIRGLLCANCNLTLGYAKDDIIILSRMIAYLKESEE